MRQLVIGLGEIGRSLQNVLQCEGIDKGSDLRGKYNVLHICYPWQSNFVGITQKYIERFHANLCIVHSTVPVGTCSQIPAIHSPVRGVHPNLEESIRTFVKYFGGPKAAHAARLFHRLGIQTIITERSETTEAMKLWSTQQYRRQILIQKEIWEYCNVHNLPFEIVYKDANRTYNEGYEALGYWNYKRPVLQHMPGKIGGHCVEPNHEILNK